MLIIASCLFGVHRGRKIKQISSNTLPSVESTRSRSRPAAWVLLRSNVRLMYIRSSASVWNFLGSIKWNPSPPKTNVPSWRAAGSLTVSTNVQRRSGCRHAQFFEHRNAGGLHRAEVFAVEGRLDKALGELCAGAYDLVEA